jgi:hypothetical protein
LIEITKVVAADAAELPNLSLELTLTQTCRVNNMPAIKRAIVYREVVPGAHAVQLEAVPPLEE